MGLTKEVRDFFTGRINRLLNTKLQAINEKIDERKVQNQAVTYLFSELQLSPALLTRLEQIEKAKDDLDAEHSEIRNLIANTAEKHGYKSRISSWRSNFVEDVECFARKEFGEKALEELYPELVPQIAQINRIKEDVEAVVLLSVSEKKLVDRLTETLNKYGGDIPELREYIPE